MYKVGFAMRGWGGPKVNHIMFRTDFTAQNSIQGKNENGDRKV